MIGTDILNIDKMGRCLQNPRFLQRVFTPNEQQYIMSRSVPAQSAAAVFCAKEAFLKALGKGVLNGIPLTDVEITHSGDGKPAMSLKRAALASLHQQGYDRAEVSLSHCTEYATAVCLLV